jgi:Cdc6-like AAA superfamily ATPase
METVDTWFNRHLEAGFVFMPNTPVNEKDLFSGRRQQITRVIDAIFQPGLHVVIFGERGVGKTSLANVLAAFAPNASTLLPIRINCDNIDDFSSVWRKVFDETNLIKFKPAIGFNNVPVNEVKSYSAKDFFANPEKIKPDDVRKALVVLSANYRPIIIIDEFDRLDEKIRRSFADLIKSLSDHAVKATVILIGVGNNVDQLIDEHLSVSRSLVQIQMPRMLPDEIIGIIKTGLTKLGSTIEPGALYEIVLLSRGLPHYAHLIGLHASRTAFSAETTSINTQHVEAAIQKALEDAQHSIKSAYHTATRSAMKDNLFADVLLACALAPADEMGEFAAQDLKIPLCTITARNYGIPNYAQHLVEFCSDKRGKILTKTGQKRLYRYKFSDPLMQPFVIMQGINDGKILANSLSTYSPVSYS